MSISSFVHLTSVIVGGKRIKRSARTTNIDSEPDDLLHDDRIDIMRIPSQIIWFVGRSHQNPTTDSSDLDALKDYFDTKFNGLEAKITNNEFKMNLDDELKKITNLSEPLQQKIKKEANVSFRNKGNKLQYEFKLEQLAKMEE